MDKRKPCTAERVYKEEMKMEKDPIVGSWN